MNRNITLVTVAAVVAIATGCASLPSPQELDKETQASMKRSFRDQGIAKVDRLNQDLAQQACSSDKAPSDAVADQINKAAMATVKWPTGGQYFGDWKEGEKLAQNGRGMTWSDSSAATSANGGNCYNCHQLSKEEISYGTIGPSLFNYGKLRQVKDIMAPSSQAVIEYTWMKLYNAKATAACSHMPRFGHAKLLDEKQMSHIMSLLLDPKSPVNQ